MATNAEMFAFLSNFGPMLGELAAKVDYLERRIELLEGGQPAAHGDPLPPGGGPEPDAFEAMAKNMLEGAMPGGGMAGIMERLKNWKPGGATATAPAAPAAAPAPETPKPT